jgi:hypothetical protein
MNFLDFLAYKWHATYRWKALDKGYNFALDLISIEGLHTKLWAPKVMRVPIVGISGLPLGVLGQNDIWVLVPWLGTKYIMRGKVVASPRFGLWWILWVCVCSWFVRAPKCSNYALINLLFVLCRSVWVIDLLVNLPSPHPEAPTHPSTPEVLRIRERAPTSSPFVVFTFGFAIESIKELGGASPRIFMFLYLVPTKPFMDDVRWTKIIQWW